MANNDRYAYSDKHKTVVFRAAFIKLFDKPDADKATDRQTWSVTGIFDPKDKALFMGPFNEVVKELWPDKAPAMVKHKSFRSPFKDGADMVNREGELYAGFEEGQLVIKINTSQGAPGVVDRQARPIASFDGRTLVDKEAGTYEEIEDNKIYSGCYMKATFVAQAYDRSDGFGVSFKLENLQKVKDGERLGGGGRAKATDDFEPVGDLEDDEFMS